MSSLFNEEKPRETRRFLLIGSLERLRKKLFGNTPTPQTSAKFDKRSITPKNQNLSATKPAIQASLSFLFLFAQLTLVRPIMTSPWRQALSQAINSLTPKND